METPFSTGCGTTTGMATPSTAQSYANRQAACKFPKTGQNSSNSNWSGANTPNTAQSLANKLGALKAAQEEASAAAHMMLNFKWQKFNGTLPAPGYYAIMMQDYSALWMVQAETFQVSRGLFEKVLGKGCLKDISAVPAATLCDVDPVIFGMFIRWTAFQACRSLKRIDIFDMQVCTREERFHTIDTMLELLYFAERFSIDQFQDEVLKLLIDACKEDDSPLSIIHIRQCHERTSQQSKTRAFFIDFLAFIVQEIDTVGNWKDKAAALNCELSFSNQELLIDLLDMLEGGRIRTSDEKISDPREAPVCTYHQHGSKKACPYKKSRISTCGVSSVTFGSLTLISEEKRAGTGEVQASSDTAGKYNGEYRRMKHVKNGRK